MPTADDLKCFVPNTDVKRGPTGSGLLDGLSFAAKDCYAIKGHTCSAGSPDWFKTNEPATKDCSEIEQLLADGASLSGVTIMDELAYSLGGTNKHYPIPVNSAAPGKICGGSSTGSASAVAGKVVDFALGGDTGGSVRVPASLCGIYGIRTTQGRLSEEGVVPLAPSFDTVGWFASDAAKFELIGESLFDSYPVREFRIPSIKIAEDAFSLVSDQVRDLAISKIQELAGNLGVRIEYVKLAHSSLSEYKELFNQVQPAEVWRTLGEWVEETNPDFNDDIGRRVENAKKMAALDLSAQENERVIVREHIRSLTADGSIIASPLTAASAPNIEWTDEESLHYRANTLQLTAPASLSGVPQISIPVLKDENGPMGLGLMGAHNSDEILLALAAKL